MTRQSGSQQQLQVLYKSQYSVCWRRRVAEKPLQLIRFCGLHVIMLALSLATARTRRWTIKDVEAIVWSIRIVNRGGPPGWLRGLVSAWRRHTLGRSADRPGLLFLNNLSPRRPSLTPQLQSSTLRAGLRPAVCSGPTTGISAAWQFKVCTWLHFHLMCSLSSVASVGSSWNYRLQLYLKTW